MKHLIHFNESITYPNDGEFIIVSSEQASLFRKPYPIIEFEQHTYDEVNQFLSEKLHISDRISYSMFSDKYVSPNIYMTIYYDERRQIQIYSLADNYFHVFNREYYSSDNEHIICDQLSGLFKYLMTPEVVDRYQS
jgi:hypothetical protein